MKNVIRPLPIFDTTLDKSLMTYLMNMGQLITVTVYIYYIEGPDKKIIVDTGGAAETFNRIGLPANQISSPEAELGKLGLSPEEIDIVLVTHLHCDHIEYGSKFKNPKFIIQRNELEFGLNPHPLFAGTIFREHFEDLNFEVIDGDEKIVEGVSVIYTPGHTPGTQSVVVETESGTAIITGFCCIKDNFIQPAKNEGWMKGLAPGSATNIIHAYDNLIKVKQMADIIIPIHESENRKMGKIP